MVSSAAFINVEPNSPEEKELMFSLSVSGFLSSAYVIFHLSFLLSLGDLCPEKK